jgi:predicted RNase H-like HicB family nuclease
LNYAAKYIKENAFLDSMAQKFTVIVEQGEDGYLISEVVGLPGCHTQAKTYDELIKRTKEAIELYLETKKPSSIKSKFLSLQQIEIGI